MFNDDIEFTGLGCFGLIVLCIIIVVASPFISFWLHYFGGWLTSLVIGGKLCSALNLLFSTTFFTPDKLPMISGALGWIGGFFKSASSLMKNKNK